MRGWPQGMRPEMARLTLARKIAAHHLDRLEKRSAFRRPTSETTNSLSVSSRSVPSWNFLRRWSVGFWRHSG